MNNEVITITSKSKIVQHESIINQKKLLKVLK